MTTFLTILTLINTIILVIVLADRIKSYFDRATWDDKIIASIKRLFKKDEL
jgi:hypothetical protein